MKDNRIVRVRELANNYANTAEGIVLAQKVLAAEKNLMDAIDIISLAKVLFLEYEIAVNAYRLHESHFIYQIAFQDGLQFGVNLAKPDK